MECKVCGTKISTGQNFCPGCGTEVVQSLNSPPSNYQKHKPSLSKSSFTYSQREEARLRIKAKGILTGEEFPIGKRVIIGRFSDETGPVDIDLSNIPEANYISRKHAEIFQEDSGKWYIKDLGSMNGTYIKSKGSGNFIKITPLQPQAIYHEDEIALGNVQFVFLND